jgi:hypothetical protein
MRLAPPVDEAIKYLIGTGMQGLADDPDEQIDNGRQARY